jgi:hypothetical protein
MVEMGHVSRHQRDLNNAFRHFPETVSAAAKSIIQMIDLHPNVFNYSINYSSTLLLALQMKKVAAPEQLNKGTKMLIWNGD